MIKFRFSPTIDGLAPIALAMTFTSILIADGFRKNSDERTSVDAHARS